MVELLAEAKEIATYQSACCRMQLLVPKKLFTKKLVRIVVLTVLASFFFYLTF